MELFKAKINEISASIAERNNLFLIEVVLRGHDKNRVIEIYFDSEKNLDADTCASLSREIQEEMEKNGMGNNPYRLEVSSPGVDRPLIFPGQYSKHLNRNFDLIIKDGETEKKLKAKLRSIEGEDFFFETDKKELIKINFNNITKAKVNISFS
jgi:ribosome maturation factor RimP